MMQRTLLTACLLCAFAVAADAQARPPQTSGASSASPATTPTLWGTISLPEGSSRPLKGIEVRLELPGHIYLNSTISDEDGRFQFRNLNNGTFHLYINLDGFEPLDQQFDVMPLSSPNALRLDPHIVMTLRRGLTDEAERHTGSGLDDRKQNETLGSPPVIDAGLLKKYPGKAVNEYLDGVKEEERGNAEKAITHFTKAVGDAPGFLEAYVELGTTRQQKGQISEAEDALRHASSIDPKSAVVLTKLGGILLDKAKLSDQKGQKDDAAKAYNDAADTLDAATRLDLSSTQAHYLLGSALFKTNELDDAELNLKKAIDAPRPFQEARLMLVNVYMKERRYRDALDQLTAYLTALPDSPQRKAIEQMQSQIRSAMNP